MKKIENARRKSAVRQLIRTGTRNAVKCSKGKAEDPLHRAMKWIVCEYLFENSIDFHTEAVFGNNERADIVVEDWGVVIEIMVSEKKKTLLKKNYPLPIIPVRNHESFPMSEILAMLEEMKNTYGTAADYYTRTFTEKL